jgi:hypothetical protein
VRIKKWSLGLVRVRHQPLGAPLSAAWVSSNANAARYYAITEPAQCGLFMSVLSGNGRSPPAGHRGGTRPIRAIPEIASNRKFSGTVIPPTTSERTFWLQWFEWALDVREAKPQDGSERQQSALSGHCTIAPKLAGIYLLLCVVWLKGNKNESNGCHCSLELVNRILYIC